jgi:hypothetical protein
MTAHLWEHSDFAIWVMVVDCNRVDQSNCQQATSSKLYHTHDTTKNFTLSLPNLKYVISFLLFSQQSQFSCLDI